MMLVWRYLDDATVSWPYVFPSWVMVLCSVTRCWIPHHRINFLSDLKGTGAYVLYMSINLGLS